MCENCNLNVCKCQERNSYYSSHIQDIFQIDSQFDENNYYDGYYHPSNNNTTENETSNIHSSYSENDNCFTNPIDNKIKQSQKLLKFASLNVCGLKRKVQYPEFGELVNKYDLFCVCETKLDRYDCIDLPGYFLFSKCRKQKYIRKSGGIGVFVKQSLSGHCSVVQTDSDYILWVSISQHVF